MMDCHVTAAFHRDGQRVEPGDKPLFVELDPSTYARLRSLGCVETREEYEIRTASNAAALAAREAAAKAGAEAEVKARAEVEASMKAPRALDGDAAPPSGKRHR